MSHTYERVPVALLHDYTPPLEKTVLLTFWIFQKLVYLKSHFFRTLVYYLK